ncbi:MAG: outer membrane protein assembly factor BamB, partial [Candidatus Eutrophobiaceae bacterium]
MHTQQHLHIRSISVLALLLLLSACDSIKDTALHNHLFGTDNAIPPSELAEFTTVIEVQKKWSTHVGNGVGDHHYKLSPVVQAQLLVSASHDGTLKALSLETGKVLWEVNTDEPISGGPGIVGDLTLVGTIKGEVLAFDSETGSELWRTKVSTEVLAAPQGSDNRIIVRAADGALFCLNASNGERIWSFSGATAPALTLRGTSAPSIHENLVITGSDNGMLLALSLDKGEEIWKREVASSSGSSDLDRIVDIDSQPLIVGNTIYVAGYQRQVMALRTENGGVLWSRDISTSSKLTIDEGRIYISDENSHIWALDRYSGTSIWKQENLDYRAITGSAVIGDALVVGDLEGYLHWLNRFDGAFIARNQASGARMLAPPQNFDGTLVTYGSDGTLSAYTYKDIPSEFLGPITQPPLTRPQRESEEPPQVAKEQAT